MIKTINTEQQYKEALDSIEVLLKKGSQLMTGEDKKELRRLSVLVEGYEQQTYPMPLQPQSILGMIQVKMFERKLKQKELALLLDISETTLSEVMNGKRKINLPLAKQLYKKLDIAPDFILEWA